jgi:hypothetical protein
LQQQQQQQVVLLKTLNLLQQGVGMWRKNWENLEDFVGIEDDDG